MWNYRNNHVARIDDTRKVSIYIKNGIIEKNMNKKKLLNNNNQAAPLVFY